MANKKDEYDTYPNLPITSKGIISRCLARKGPPVVKPIQKTKNKKVRAFVNALRTLTREHGFFFMDDNYTGEILIYRLDSDDDYFDHCLIGAIDGEAEFKKEYRSRSVRKQK